MLRGLPVDVEALGGEPCPAPLGGLVEVCGALGISALPCPRGEAEVPVVIERSVEVAVPGVENLDAVLEAPQLTQGWAVAVVETLKSKTSP